MNWVRLLKVSMANVLILALLPSAAMAQSVTYYHTDALGSPVAVTDADGNVLDRTDYEPFGQVISEPVSDGPGYTGHESDAATGLSYMQQRYYDPNIGRFLSVDPVGAGGEEQHNLYSYAEDSPYRFVDPDGRASGAPAGSMGANGDHSEKQQEHARKGQAAERTAKSFGSMNSHHAGGEAFMKGVSAIGLSVMQNPTTEGLQKLARSEGYVQAADSMIAAPGAYYHGETGTPAVTNRSTNDITFYKPAFEHGYFGLVSFMDHEVVHFYQNLLGGDWDTRSRELRAYQYQMGRPAYSQLTPLDQWRVKEKYDMCRVDGDCE